MHLISGLQPNLSVLYREIGAICFDNHIKHWTRSVDRMWKVKYDFLVWLDVFIIHRIIIIIIIIMCYLWIKNLYAVAFIE